MSNEVNELEEQIANNKYALNQAKCLERLNSNRDFKDLILNGYLREEAIRLVSLKSDPSQQTLEKQAAIIKDIDAIGALETYMRSVRQFGDIAARAIKDAEDVLEAIRNEEA